MKRTTSSHQRYRAFVNDYRRRRVDADKSDGRQRTDRPPKGDAKPRNKRREYLSAYWRWLRPHRYSISALIVLACISAGVQMITPLFMRFIVDHVLLNARLDWATRLTTLNVAGTLLLAMVILFNLVEGFKDYRQRLLNTRVMLALRRALFERLLHLPLPDLWNMKTGGILSRLTGDLDTTTGFLQMALVSPCAQFVRLIVSVVVLLMLNWHLALIALIVVPGAMTISYVVAKRIRPIYRSVRMDAEQIDGRVGETFSGIRIVRAFRREKHELLSYLGGRHSVLRKELFAQRREIAVWTTWGLMMGTIDVAIVWYGGHLNLRGRASVGDIMAFQWYVFQMLNPLWNIVSSFSQLQRACAAIERVFELLAMPEDKPDRLNARHVPEVVDEIRFENVEFGYREGQPVIRDFTVAVPGGAMVALVGRSGVGKTTVTDLVARFHDPQKGQILLNGIDLRDFHLKSYRGLLAMVQQDVFLFDGSVRDNIAYGRHDATDAEIADAARRANAHEFIAKLPEQYETLIGERGITLSGGQQQRLAIARAILAGASILILDEATSNLDTESEQLIQEAMNTLLTGKTTFVIAHRLTTVRRADLILVMDDGCIAERGSHQELMSRRGVYYDMVVRQMESQGYSDAEVSPARVLTNGIGPKFAATANSK
jgi:ATP-binding cassette, subfamily B, bacterial